MPPSSKYTPTTSSAKSQSNPLSSKSKYASKSTVQTVFPRGSKVTKECVEKTNKQIEFCRFYSLLNKNYLSDPTALAEALKNFKENMKNPHINFPYKYFDLKASDIEKELKNYIFKPNKCSKLIKTNPDNLFCINVESNNRFYEGWDKFIEAWMNFQRKAELYRKRGKLSESKWDPYFDISLEKNETSKIPFQRFENIQQCTWTIERLSKVYLEQENSRRKLKKFCELTITRKKVYKSIDTALVRLDNFLKHNRRRGRILDKYFDVPEEELKNKTVTFTDSDACLKEIGEWSPDRIFKKFFCQNFFKSKEGTKKKEDNNNKFKVLEFESIFNSSLHNFYRNNKKLIHSDYFYLTNEEVLALRNITFPSVEQCVIDLPFLIRIIYEGEFRQDKVNIFCNNYVLFNRTYRDVNFLREKLASFTENFETYHNMTLGPPGMAKLTVDKNKFFDYSNEEYTRMKTGYIMSRRPNLTTKCGFDSYDKEAVIKYYNYTAYQPLNAFNGRFRRKAKKASFIDVKALKSGKKVKRYGKLRIFRGRRRKIKDETAKDLSESGQSYLSFVFKSIMELIKRISKVDTNDRANLEEIKDGCPKLDKQPLKLQEQFLLESFDLTKIGIISDEVDNQGNCGSCWASAMASMLESRIALTNKQNPIRISRQHLLDCSSRGSCDGGNAVGALHYVMKNGTYSESNYPEYTGKKEECAVPPDAKPLDLKIQKSNITVHNQVNPLQLRFVLFGGPVIVNLDAKAPEFVFYSSGILRYDCRKENHSVLLVGYGINKELNKGYWIIKNSWGKEWGMDGYAHIEIDDYWDACGMYQKVIEIR